MQTLVKGHTSALSIQMTACDWAELGMRPRLEPMANGSSLAMCTRVFGPNLALLNLTPLRMLPFFEYPPEIRRIIYTTNAIESVNMSLRKVSKSRGSFPSDEALLKLFYLALKNISKKWTMPLRDWKAALTRFTIQFEGRMPKD